jgi:ECF sigma factor
MELAFNPSSDLEVSVLLQAWSDGDRDALEKLTPIVYNELHRLARHYMRGERSGGRPSKRTAVVARRA